MEDAKNNPQADGVPKEGVPVVRIDAQDASGQLADRCFLRTDNGRFERVWFADLLWLEAERSYCRVVLRDRSILFPEPLSNVYEKLAHPHLVRIHRSYVVNATCIDAIDRNTLIVNGQLLPVSQLHQKALFAKIRLLR